MATFATFSGGSDPSSHAEDHRAMKLVAAAKLRRAQERILAARPYATKMAELLGNLVSERPEHRPSAARAARGHRAGRSSSSRPIEAWPAPSTPTSSAGRWSSCARIQRGRGHAGRGRPQGAAISTAAGDDDQARHDRLLGSAGLLPRHRAGRLFHAAVSRRRGGRGRTSSTTSSDPLPSSVRSGCSSCRSRKAEGESAEERRWTTSTSRAEAISSELLPRHVRRRSIAR